MSGNAAVWGRVRGRLRAFPERLAACGAEAAAYGRCVQASTAPGGRLTKDLCVQEFEALRSCFAAVGPGRQALAAQDWDAPVSVTTRPRIEPRRPRGEAFRMDKPALHLCLLPMAPRGRRLRHLKLLELKGLHAHQGTSWAEGEFGFPASCM
ncbi:NADH dehydrogenase [ubiquinone] 1 alpha subcomplex assembly factor 8 isoform X1 [Crocuta crocuta]